MMLNLRMICFSLSESLPEFFWPKKGLLINKFYNRTNYLEVVHFGLAFPGQLVFGHPLLDFG